MPPASNLFKMPAGNKPPVFSATKSPPRSPASCMTPPHIFGILWFDASLTRYLQSPFQNPKKRGLNIWGQMPWKTCLLLVFISFSLIASKVMRGTQIHITISFAESVQLSVLFYLPWKSHWTVILKANTWQEPLLFHFRAHSVFFLKGTQDAKILT